MTLQLPKSLELPPDVALSRLADYPESGPAKAVTGTPAPIEFGPVSLEALTSFIAFQLRARPTAAWSARAALS